MIKFGSEVHEILLPSWHDERGQITQAWNKNFSGFNLAQSNVTVSRKNVLRGIHGYDNLGRICMCVYGRIHFVVANCDRESELFGSWISFILEDKHPNAIYVPPKFGIAALTRSETSVFLYHWDGTYEGNEQFRFRYDDPQFGINWPPLEGKPILSERDRCL